MNAGDGRQIEEEKKEGLRWLIEDSLLLSCDEKLALLDKLNEMKAGEQSLLFEILLDEKRIPNLARRRALESEG